MSVKAYVLFKVTSGTEGDVCKKIADFDEDNDVDQEDFGIFQGYYTQRR